MSEQRHPSRLNGAEVIDIAEALDRLASKQPQNAKVLKAGASLIHNMHATLILVRSALEGGAGR